MTIWNEGYIVDVPYTHGFYRELTPALLNFALLVQKVRGPRIDKSFAYCELGCGQGVTTNILAAANGAGAFVATDFNPAHVASAHRLAADARLRNVDFFEESFAEFLREDLPPFDFICLHGVYSWISAENRRAIVEFIRTKLKAGGVVYVSYNSQPGWAPTAPLRLLLRMHAEHSMGAPLDRIDAALAFCDAVEKSGALYFRGAPAVGSFLARIRELPKQYLVHEYLNDHWQPFYHAEVARELAEGKLQYACSANLLDHVDAINLATEQQRLLAAIGDPLFRETLRDYMVAQRFRRDIFVKGLVQLSDREHRELLLEQRFALTIAPRTRPGTIEGPLGKASLHAEVYDPVTEALGREPRRLSELMAVPAIAAQGIEKVLQALVVMVGAGWAQPCPDPESEARSLAASQSFNSQVLERACQSDQLHWLASPVTGGGIAMNRIVQLFALGTVNSVPDLARHVLEALFAAGQRLVKDGRTIESVDESLTELEAQAEQFNAGTLPLLKQLRIL